MDSQLQANIRSIQCWARRFAINAYTASIGPVNIAHPGDLLLIVPENFTAGHRSFAPTRKRERFYPPTFSLLLYYPVLDVFWNLKSFSLRTSVPRCVFYRSEISFALMIVFCFLFFAFVRGGCKTFV